MIIPDTVKIGGINYTIHFEEQIIDDHQCELCGQIIYDKAIIKIDSKIQDYQGQCLTLLHEVVHGIARHFKLKLTEKETDHLAIGMYMVITDNPKIFERRKK